MKDENVRMRRGIETGMRMVRRMKKEDDECSLNRIV